MHVVHRHFGCLFAEGLPCWDLCVSLPPLLHDLVLSPSRDLPPIEKGRLLSGSLLVLVLEGGSFGLILQWCESKVRGSNYKWISTTSEPVCRLLASPNVVSARAQRLDQSF